MLEFLKKCLTPPHFLVLYYDNALEDEPGSG